MVKSPSDKIKLDSTFTVIYSYSHQKFYEYIRVPEVNVIFRGVFQNISIEDFIENHETLNLAATREKYNYHIQHLISKLDKE